MAISAEHFAQLQENYPYLAALSAAAGERVMRSAQVVQVPAGQVVFDELQPCQAYPLLCRGEIRVSKLAPNGRELPLYRVAVGETCVISSACLLGKAPYNARGTAMSDCELLLLPAPVFDSLLDEPDFRQGVFSLMAERIATLMQLIDAIAFQRLDQRLAALLLERGPVLHLTHQELANELGSVREIVSRLLKTFANQGWVTLRREHIEVVNAEGLRQMAQHWRE